MYTTDVFSFFLSEKIFIEDVYILHYSHASELPFKINLDLNVDSRVFDNFMTLQKAHAKIFHYDLSAFFF